MIPFLSEKSAEHRILQKLTRILTRKVADIRFEVSPYLNHSRRPNLMDKKLEYTSLYDLVMDFEQAYRNCGHRLVKCRIGNLISHDMYSIAPIPWKGITMHLRFVKK